MKKQTVSIALACLIALGVGNVATAASVQATQTPVMNASGRVLGMKEVANLFSQKFDGALIHSIGLEPQKGSFSYTVDGISKGRQVTANVDIITGDFSKVLNNGKVKDVASKIFNPNAVINEHQAETIAVKAVGEGAVAKGWVISADAGDTNYVVTVYQSNQSTEVTINAANGAVVAKGNPVDLPAQN